jgi:hypothetical protein
MFFEIVAKLVARSFSRMLFAADGAARGNHEPHEKAFPSSIVRKPVSICFCSGIITRDERGSAAAWAIDPVMSYLYNRQSNETDSLKRCPF